MRSWRIPLRDGGPPMVMREGPKEVWQKCGICGRERLCVELLARIWKSAADSRYVCTDCWPRLDAELIE